MKKKKKYLCWANEEINKIVETIRGQKIIGKYLS